MIVLITNVSDFLFLLDARYQYFMYFILFLWFLGNECVVVGFMILNVQIAPSSQQARASGLISFGNSLVNFFATLIAGQLYYYHGMATESLVIVVVMVVEIVLIVWFYRLKKVVEDRERMKINDGDVQQYAATLTSV